MPGPQKNMEVGVNVFLNGYQKADGTWKVDATYTQGGTLPLSAQVVGADGTIDLRKLNDPNNQYNAATDIQMWLDNESLLIDNQGNKLNIQFPEPRTSAITFSGPNASAEFTPPGDEGSAYGLGFTDNDNQSGDYGYCLTVNASPPGNPNQGYVIPLDPKIINK